LKTIKLPPDLPDIDKLIDTAIETGGETDRFDFKAVLDLRTDEHKARLVRAIGAFGNTDEGGFILIGIANDRRIIGLSGEIFELFDQTRVQRLVNQYLAPPPIIQIRKHEREGDKVVIIEVQPFMEFPSIVRQSATYGNERLIAGSILFRNAGAESAVLTAEADMRKLCDVIVKRRASVFVEIFQRGTLGRIVDHKSEFDELDVLVKRSDQEWPSSEGAPPYIEVAFSSANQLNLTSEQLRSLIPHACIRTRHGFPFFDVTGQEVYRGTSWGWYGRIPFSSLDEGGDPPSYLWMLSRQGTFIDREDLWEDSPGSVIQGGVGLFHVIGRIILVIRFLDNFSTTIKLDDNIDFKILVACNNVKNRYLQDERSDYPARFLPHAVEQRVEAKVEVSLRILQKSRKDVALRLLEEMAWQFGRQDYTRQILENYLLSAKEFLGREYILTE
jgi:hypothetical protein